MLLQLILLSTLTGIHLPAGQVERPNVIVLISDDQAVGTMGFEGHAFSQTPALDRLATEGASFSQAFVTTSLCSPSRASYLTGRYARTHGVLVNRDRFPADLPTFASVMTEGGYDSAYVGKWHMGDEAGARPGFGYTASYVGQGNYNSNTFLVGSASNVEEVERSGWVDEVATDFALEFLNREREAPFLLVLGFKGPHRPQIPRRSDRRLFKDVSLMRPANADALPPFPLPHEFEELAREADEEPQDYHLPAEWSAPSGSRKPSGWPGKRGDDEQRERDYFRVIHGVDRSVGRILQALDNSAIGDNTLVVFASDNGMCIGNHGQVGKRNAYEEALRVPLLMRYPRTIQPGLRVNQMVLNIDLAPTLLELVGLKVPQGVQGRSLVPLLAGTDPPKWRDSAVFEFYLDHLEHVPSFLPTNFCLRTEEWKWIEYPGFPQWTELYNLTEDPLEQRNRVKDPAAREVAAGLGIQLRRAEQALGPRGTPPD
ncbi:MAG: sulfatase-like hydrolase/transferase [Planctomycetota bacterium]|jgi:arylsulfatase A-like enzyme|nr:sulfatase-like hydrolase/transferase [Planctomycetota bacterium]